METNLDVLACGLLLLHYHLKREMVPYTDKYTKTVLDLEDEEAANKAREEMKGGLKKRMRSILRTVSIPVYVRVPFRDDMATLKGTKDIYNTVKDLTFGRDYGSTYVFVDIYTKILPNLKLIHNADEETIYTFKV